MSDAPATTAPNEDSLKFAALIGYGLFGLALFNGVTAVIGVVLAYVMRGNAQGTVWESHFRNQIRIFWVAAIMAVVLIAIIVEGFGGFFYVISANHDPAPAITGMLFLLVPAVCLIMLLFAVWYLYRTLRGLIRALESKAY